MKCPMLLTSITPGLIKASDVFLIRSMSTQAMSLSPRQIELFCCSEVRLRLKGTAFSFFGFALRFQPDARGLGRIHHHRLAA